MFERSGRGGAPSGGTAAKRRVRWAAVLALAAVLAAPGVPAFAGDDEDEDEIAPLVKPDKRGDVVGCESGLPVKNKANDIRDVSIDINGVIEVRMFRSIEKSLNNEFSFAIVVTITLEDGTVRSFRVQVHDGMVEKGEVDPETRALLPEGAPIEVVGRSMFIETGEFAAFGALVKVESFNKRNEQSATTCDDAVLDVAEELGGGADPAVGPPPTPPEPEPSETGGLEDIEEVIQ